MTAKIKVFDNDGVYLGEYIIQPIKEVDMGIYTKHLFDFEFFTLNGANGQPFTLDKIRREIEELYNGCGLENDAIDKALAIIDKYRGE